MGYISTPDTRVATLIVAASDSEYPAKADYQCDGVDDHVEIQAALDALPTTGGEVKLLDGTYNCEVQIDLDTNQTLRGCGRNIILTTSTANLVFLSAVGVSGTEKTGIVIADLQIDGGASNLGNVGIYFEYVDYSFIHDVYSRRHKKNAYRAGIALNQSDFNIITENTCIDNGYYAIFLLNSDDNTILGNTCQISDENIYLEDSNNNIIAGNISQGGSCGIYCHGSSYNSVAGNIFQTNSWSNIYLESSSNNNTVTGNTCRENEYGVYLTDADNNSIIGNICQLNLLAGIYLDTSHNNSIIGNNCTENSQTTNNTYDDIYLDDSDYNNIQSNTCRAGAQANKPRYGINIGNVACDNNLVTNNDLYDDGFGTGSLNDAGAGTVTVAGNRV